MASTAVFQVFLAYQCSILDLEPLNFAVPPHALQALCASFSFHLPSFLLVLESRIAPTSVLHFPTWLCALCFIKMSCPTPSTLGSGATPAVSLGTSCIPPRLWPFVFSLYQSSRYPCQFSCCNGYSLLCLGFSGRGRARLLLSSTSILD